MRQHVNPLSRFFQLPLRLPEPNELFAKNNLPIHLDIGSARGKFLLGLASSHLDCNYLGVEIRFPLVQAANKDRDNLELKNLAFLFCNANVSLEGWLEDLPDDMLHMVSIQFPDPWFKRRHYKRRVLQPELLISLAKALKPGRGLFIQSDLLDVINPMIKLVESSGYFDLNKEFKDINSFQNPFPFATERESYVLDKGRPVYRILFSRNFQSVPELFTLEKLYS